MQKEISELMQYVQSHQSSSDPAHDALHIERVYHTCLKFGRALDADLKILLAASLLHDIINVPKDSKKRKQASQFSAEQAAKVLKKLNWSDDDIERIQVVIHEHSFSLGKSPTSLESKILQDADRLDALGAIGIMRLAATATKMNSTFYHKEDPFAKTRELDDARYAIDHIFKKLFSLPGQMNTQLGKEEAIKRVEFLKIFVQNLADEIDV